MAFKKAERTKLWARVAIYGPSGSGKSYTGLRIATGLAIRTRSRIAAIDTESRSLSKYADRFDFDVDDLGDKTIDAYIASINQCVKEGYKVLFIDSLTHAWKELLEEVDRISAKSFGGNSWAGWSKGTPKQNKLINTIVSFPGHLIVTMRSKTEWSVGKNDDGKSTVSRNGLSPDQGKGIEYEFDILMDINQGHIAEIQKDRTGKFQDQMIEKPGEEFGEALYEWLNSGSAPPPPPPSTLRQQYINGMGELKNIILTKVDDGSRLFTDEEYTTIKTTLEGLKNKTDEERLSTVEGLLIRYKEQLKIRFDNWMKAKQPPATAETKKDEPVKESFADGFKDYLNQKMKTDAKAAEQEATPKPDIPSLYTEDEEPDMAVAGAELDIF